MEEGDEEDDDDIESGTILVFAKEIAANSVVQVRQVLEGMGINDSVYDALEVIEIVLIWPLGVRKNDRFFRKIIGMWTLS